MAKDRMKTTVLVADGAAGLVQVPDLRFEEGNWPVSLNVAAKDADEWFKQFNHACSERGWNSGGTSQLDSVENSGTWYVRESQGGQPPVALLIWERRRAGNLSVKIRPGPMLGESGASELLSLVDTRVRSRFRETYYRLSFLEYQGKPWHGEVWLGEGLRLGPPKHLPDSIIGPQAVRVDADVAGVGRMDANCEFGSQIKELAIFLTVLLGIDVFVPSLERLWVWSSGSDGKTHCDVRQRGYWESSESTCLPAHGLTPGIPTVRVERPDLGRFSPLNEKDEIVLPDDIQEIWKAFAMLDGSKRSQFLEAGMTFQLGLRVWSEFRSASLALLVVACEALKNRQRSSKKKQGRQVKLFQTIEALLGRDIVNQLRGLELNPQGVRDEHFHLGKLFGEELDPFAFTSTYRDPTFGDVHRLVTRVCRAAIIEWLRRGGTIETA